jgi:protein gp37
MSATSTIEWTDATWNPVRGCTKVSPGCAHCYAETFAERFRGVEGHPYEQGFDLRLVPDKLQDPLRWTKPRMIFVNSMSDLFHTDVPEDYIDKVFAVMALAHWHTFQVLTKRADRMQQYAAKLYEQFKENKPWGWGAVRAVKALSGLHRKRDDTIHHRIEEFGIAHRAGFPNVILGVSVENRKHGLPRIEHLRRTPAAVRMLSIEPLLEDLGQLDLTGIGWVIVGGESGHGARPMHPAWVRSIRDQCVKAGVPFFFKQVGEWGWSGTHEDRRLLMDESGRTAPHNTPKGIGTHVRQGQCIVYRVGKKAAGRMLDGRIWDEYPAAAKAVPA